MKISVNAPSYKRANDVKTLSYLPFCKIWVDGKEYEDYKRNYPDADIQRCADGVQGNLCRVRNYILRTEFERGMDAVLIIDDDLIAIERYEADGENGYLNKKVSADEFFLFLEKYSQLCKDFGFKFWGLNCVKDQLAYKHSVPFCTTKYIGGPFQCFLKGNRCFYDEALPLKEDYDMTLQQLNLERGCLRVNAYHYVCYQSVNVGGCASYRNRQREMEQFKLLQKKWGGQIIRVDEGNSRKNKKKEQKYQDYNPILKTPIRGI